MCRDANAYALASLEMCRDANAYALASLETCEDANAYALASLDYFEAIGWHPADVSVRKFDLGPAGEGAADAYLEALVDGEELCAALCRRGTDHDRRSHDNGIVTLPNMVTLRTGIMEADGTEHDGKDSAKETELAESGAGIKEIACTAAKHQQEEDEGKYTPRIA